MAAMRAESEVVRRYKPFSPSFNASTGTPMSSRRTARSARAASAGKAAPQPDAHHEQRLIEAREEQVDVREHAPQQRRPIDATGVGTAIDLRHVQRGGQSSRSGSAENLAKLLAAIAVQPPHDRRISEMEQPRPGQSVGVDVVRPEGVVGPRMVKKDPVDRRRIQNNGVRAVLTGGDNHALGQTRLGCRQPLADDAAEGVIADFSHQRSRHPQAMQRQAGVGNRSPRRQHRRPDARETSGSQERRQACHARQIGNDVQADVACHHGIDG